MRRPKPDEFQPVEEKSLLLELKRNWFFFALLIGIAFGAFMMLRPPPAGEAPSLISTSWRTPPAEEQLRDFVLVTRSGDTNNISTYYGRPTILMGYQLECENCIRSLKTLDEMAPLLRGRVDILPVAMATQRHSLTDLIEKQYEEAGITNLRPYTVSKSVSDGLFDPDLLPVSYIVDGNNMVARIHNGAGDWTDPALLDLIDQLENIENQ